MVTKMVLRTGMYKINIFILSAAFLSSCAFSSKTAKNYLEKSENKQYDVVVVPGIPFKDGKWDRIMKGRIYWSKYLYDKGITKNIMYSGSAVYSPYPEAGIMALYALEIGIPGENIYTETRAEHSTENICYSYLKAKKLGFDSIALASDPYQTKMLRKFVKKKVSPDIGLLPILFDTLKAMEPEMTDPEIDYQSLYIQDFIPLDERENFIQRLKGTMGLSMDKSGCN
jgi:hypothetical protein